MIRVLVAEDSPTIRELLIGILESDSEIRVVGRAKNGAEALVLASELKPDLITMDIHMPEMDGLEATREIMIRAPTPILVVSSSTSGREVELSMQAIAVGALMVVAKPDDPRSAEFERRRSELVAMAKAMARVKVVRRWAQPHHSPPPPMARPAVTGGPTRLIAIAASTGGPAALQRLLTALAPELNVPVVIVQHIATGFVSGLAQWLRSTCRVDVDVATHGERLRPRRVLLAPDERQLGVTPEGRAVVIEAPAVGGFRPSATYLFESAAKAYGAAVAAAILTGMGSDGVAGLRALKAAGARVYAQDEASSVVFGMPGEAVAAGVVDAALTVDEIAQRLPGAPSRRQGIRILLIDDDATYAELVRIVLSGDGHHVRRAKSAEDGLQQIVDETPDLLMIDKHLPGMDGLAAMKAFKQDARLRAVPIVGLTSAPVSRQDEAQARAAGFDAYVTKPIDAAEFRAALGGFLGR